MFQRSRQRNRAVTNSGKRRIETVIVSLCNRVELVVVTSRTSQRHSQKRFAGGADDFVQRVGANLSRLNWILIADIVVRTRHQKCRTDRHVRIVLPKDVTRDVFANELIDWFAFVDRPDHVIAKRPDVVDDDVPFVPDAFPEADDVQPVSTPSFTVMWRGQQAIDQFFISFRIRIVDERFDVLRSWRQPDQVVRCATNQRAAVRWRVQSKFLISEFRTNEFVDRSRHTPCAVRYWLVVARLVVVRLVVVRLGHMECACYFQRLQRPPRRIGLRLLFDHNAVGPLRSLIDPLTQPGHFIC